jgi:5-methylcytosine-specific restriction endonuclease McrA
MPQGRVLLKRHSIPVNIQLYVIKRDRNTCQYCGKLGVFVFRFGKPAVVENPHNLFIEEGSYCNSRDVIKFEIDHIVPWAYGGRNELNNLALSCRRCNRGKEAKGRVKHSE